MSSTPFADLLKAASEAKYQIIPGGDYIVACRDATDTKSSTGKPMIKLAVKVLVGPYAGSSVLTQQTLTTDNPAALAIFFRFLEAFGLDEEFLAALPPAEDGGPNIRAVCAALKGRVAVATVEVHEWNGEDRNGVSKFKKPSDEQTAAAKAALGDDAAAFAKPKAGPADPFAASAAPAAAAQGKGAEDPF